MSDCKLIGSGLSPRIRFNVEINLENETAALNTVKWLRKNKNSAYESTNLEAWLAELADIIENN